MRHREVPGSNPGRGVQGGDTQEPRDARTPGAVAATDWRSEVQTHCMARVK